MVSRAYPNDSLEGWTPVDVLPLGWRADRESVTGVVSFGYGGECHDVFLVERVRSKAGGRDRYVAYANVSSKPLRKLCDSLAAAISLVESWASDEQLTSDYGVAAEMAQRPRRSGRNSYAAGRGDRRLPRGSGPASQVW